MKTTTIYIRLLNEGTDVFRPVQAEKLEKNIFKIIETESYNPECETWEFIPGQIVHCKNLELHGGVKMVARSVV